MSDVSRSEAEDVLEKAEEALDRPRLDDENLSALEDLTDRLRSQLEEGGDFDSTVQELEAVLDDIDRSMMNQEPEMEPEEEREAREEGPREEEYGDLDR